MASSQIAKDKFTFFTNPRPGDLVVEISTAHMGKYDEDSIGYLLEVVNEPVEEDSWEQVTYIRKLMDGKVFRWTNARFIRVPEGMA